MSFSSKPLKILHIRNLCGYYGVEKCILSWVDELKHHSFEFEFFLFDHPSRATANFLKDLRQRDIRSRVVSRNQLIIPGLIFSLVHLIRKGRFDIIHTHDNRSQVVGWVVGKITGTPVICTVHGYIYNSRIEKIFNRLNREMIRFLGFEKVTAPSRHLARQFSRAVYLPNAVSGCMANKTPREKKFPDPPCFGVIARLSREKGIRIFLDAVRLLPANWRFVVVGEGPAEEQLKNHPAAHRITWTGFLPDAFILLDNWSALVIPSFSEGLPMVLLEAMARAVPVVASKTGGIPELLSHNREGLLVTPGDYRQMSKMMTKVATDPVFARILARNAQRKFFNQYCLENRVHALCRLYKEISQ